MKVDRSDPFVWGGAVIEEEGTMEGRELEDPATVTEFCRELPRPEGEPEEVAVFLGTMFPQEGEDPRRGSVFGRAWGHVSNWIGDGDVG